MSWEADLGQRLKALPDRRAPRALAAAILMRAKPWHQRPWWTWNAPARAAFVASVAASVALLVLVIRPVAAGVAEHWGWALALARAVRPAAFVLAALAAAPCAALVYIKEKA